jgi:hypothetical protein
MANVLIFRVFLVSEVKVLHALCVVGGVEHKHDSRPSSVTRALLRLSQYVSIIGQEVLYVTRVTLSVQELQNINATSVHCTCCNVVQKRTLRSANLLSVLHLRPT